MKNMGKIMILSGVIASLGMFINILNVNAMRRLGEIGFRTGEPHKKEETYSQTRMAEYIRQQVHEYLGIYDFKTGQAVQLFPNNKWKQEELEFFLKSRCDAVRLLEVQGIKDKWVRFERKTAMYKFIDENIDYFREQVRRPSIMKDLIERGIHVSSEGLTTAVNRIKRDLRDSYLAHEIWTDSTKWSYLEEHYEQAHRYFFGE